MQPTLKKERNFIYARLTPCIHIQSHQHPAPCMCIGHRPSGLKYCIGVSTSESALGAGELSSSLSSSTVKRPMFFDTVTPIIRCLPPLAREFQRFFCCVSTTRSCSMKCEVGELEVNDTLPAPLNNRGRVRVLS